MRWACAGFRGCGVDVVGVGTSGAAMVVLSSSRRCGELDAGQLLTVTLREVVLRSFERIRWVERA